jgi:hypothetical protein
MSELSCVGHSTRRRYARKPRSESCGPRSWRRSPLKSSIKPSGDGPLTSEEIETASQRFKNALIERAQDGELTHHLGYPPNAAKLELATNHRNVTAGGASDLRRAGRI